MKFLAALLRRQHIAAEIVLKEPGSHVVALLSWLRQSIRESPTPPWRRTRIPEGPPYGQFIRAGS